MNFVISFLDAQHFTYPQSSRNIERHASPSGHVDFLFAYMVPNKNQIRSITCGYETTNRKGYDFIAQKRRTRPAIIYKNYAGKAEIVSDKTGTSLTIRLKNLKLKDSRNFLQCMLVYSGLTYYSGYYNLKVYGK